MRRKILYRLSEGDGRWAQAGQAVNYDHEIDQLVILIEGAYFGLVNHYHINNRAFDGAAMKEEFHRLLDRMI